MTNNNSTSLPPRRNNLMISAAVIVLIGAAVWIYKHETAAPPPKAVDPAVEITSVLVKQEDVPRYITGVGTVTSNASVTVRTRIDGQLDKVGFVEGQDVKAGQLLAQIDPRALQAQLAQAEAQKAKDQASLMNAKIDLQRYIALRQQDAATQQTLDTQKSLVAQLDAAVKTDDAQIQYAKVQLDYTHITAPISGRVGARLVDPGNIVHAADANGLVVINQIDPIAVVFTLPEDNFQDINKALHASSQPLSVGAFDRDSNAALATGQLVLLNNQIDTTNGTVQLKAKYQNPTHVLWPGQYVNARLQLGNLPQALTVPAAVVQRGQDGTYVYVVNADNTVKDQAIHVVQIQDGVAAIDQGLSAGQRVVLDGQYKLKPGATIVEHADNSEHAVDHSKLTTDDAVVSTTANQTTTANKAVSGAAK